MSKYIVEDPRKVTTHRFIEMKRKGEKIAMLTAYDYTTAMLIDGAGVDAILVGDSASNVMAGNVTTLPITLEAESPTRIASTPAASTMDAIV